MTLYRCENDDFDMHAIPFPSLVQAIPVSHVRSSRTILVTQVKHCNIQTGQFVQGALHRAINLIAWSKATHLAISVYLANYRNIVHIIAVPAEVGVHVTTIGDQFSPAVIQMPLGTVTFVALRERDTGTQKNVHNV